MWKAILQSINENPVPNDSVDVVINFVHESGKEFSKSYNVHADNLKDVADVQALANSEIAKLTKFSDAVVVLQSFVGKDILSGETKAEVIGKLPKQK